MLSFRNITNCHKLFGLTIKKYNQHYLTNLHKNITITNKIKYQNEFLIPSSATIVSRYYFHSSVTNEIKSESIEKSSASCASQIEHIYYGTLTNKIKAVKIFSLTTSATGLLAQPLLIEQGSKIGGTPMVVFICSFVGFFTFVTPILIHFITKKYVTEIYYDKISQEYNATTISFFLRKKQIKFKVGDVHVPEISGMFSTFNIGKKSVFVDPELFSDTSHYIRLMGFDKPIDFKLTLPDEKESNIK